LSCNSFYLLNDNTSLGTENRLELKYFIENLDNLSENIKGIIIDLRGNLGGQTSDLNFFVGKFIDAPLHYGFTQTKYEQGKYDYTPWIKAFINPESQSRNIDLPIIVMVDNYTASVAELVAIAFEHMPTSVLIGENTYGATGLLAPKEIYKTGSFTIPNFMVVQASSAKFKAANNQAYESIGLQPDILIPFNIDSVIVGRDLQLEKAISIIK